MRLKYGGYYERWIKRIKSIDVKNFPNTHERYNDLVNFTGTEDIGSHVVYCDVFVPYIINQAENNNEEELIRFFHFIEWLLDSGVDLYEDVAIVTIIEDLVTSRDFNKSFYEKFCYEKTKRLMDEVIKYYRR